MHEPKEKICERYKMKEQKIICDVCGNEENVKEEVVQVIFTTEQNEDKSVDPYLYNMELDICNKCESIILNGNYLFAKGAMGHNKYFFKKKICRRIKKVR